MAKVHTYFKFSAKFLLILLQALRMILQLGVEPSWFNTSSTTLQKRPHSIPGTPSSAGDLRSYMINIPPLGDTAVPEMLLKVLEPYRKEGLISSYA